jgi:hypothetical protein
MTQSMVISSKPFSQNFTVFGLTFLRDGTTVKKMPLMIGAPAQEFPPGYFQNSGKKALWQNFENLGGDMASLRPKKSSKISLANFKISDLVSSPKCNPIHHQIHCTW